MVDRWWLLPLTGFGLLIVGVLIVAASPERFDAYGSYRDANVALVPLLGAVILLIVGIARLAALLPTKLGALRLIGFVGVSAGVVWAIAPWIGILGVTFSVRPPWLPAAPGEPASSLAVSQPALSSRLLVRQRSTSR